MTAGLYDEGLEWAIAGEAVYDHGRYTAYGVRPEHFATDDARAVVEAACACFAASGRVTLESVAVELQRAGRLAKLGGPGELAVRLSPSAVADPVELKRLANYRRLRDLFARGQAAAARKDDAAIMAICEESSQGLALSDDAQIMSQWELIELLLNEHANPQLRPAEIYPGIDAIRDAIDGNFSIGEMTVFLAPTNVGKTATVLEMLLGASAAGVGCGFIGVEDSARTFGARIWGAHAGVNPRFIKQHRVDGHQWQRMCDAAEKLRRDPAPFWLVDAMGSDEMQICSIMSRMAARGVKYVAVDYLGKVKSSVRYPSPRERTDHVMSSLKVHARRMGQHLLLVSQISRPEDKSGKVRAPTKFDAKESGNIENEAETILGIWREEEDDFAPIRGRVLKGKDGGNGREWLMQRSKRDGRLRVISPEEVEL